MHTKSYTQLATANRSLLGSSSEHSTFSAISQRSRLKRNVSYSSLDSNTAVRFDLQANGCQDTWSRKELTKDDVAQLWYSPKEVKMIKSTLQTTLRMKKTGRFDENSEKHSFRGIETEEQKTRRRERSAKQTIEVFWCSASEYFDTSEDISSKLQTISRVASEEAFQRAKEDRDHALKAYDKMSDI